MLSRVGTSISSDLQAANEVSLGASEFLRAFIFQDAARNAFADRWRNTYVVGMLGGLILTIPDLALNFWANP
jgi:hypothetical protein